MKNKLLFDKYFWFLFLGLSSLFWIDFLLGDNRVFLFINRKIANSGLDFVCLNIFVPLFLLLGLVPFLMIFSRKYWKLGLFSLISGFLCYQIGNLIKLLVSQPRPFEILPARILGPWTVRSFSFPSTTTMLGFGLAIPILIEKPKYGLPLLTLSSLLGFSVIYTGFHFPQDVIVGAIFSLGIVFLMEQIKSRKYKAFLRTRN